ncbi:MAG: hypothetical protein V2A34_05365 [Lentisphaerota bacterium]
MKKLVLAVAIVGLLAAQSMAQLGGIPIGMTAAPTEQGLFTVGAQGSHLSNKDIDNMNVFGGRVTYGLLDNLLLAADLGLAMPGKGKNAFAYQGLIQYNFAGLDLPFDLGARGTVSQAKFSGENGNPDVKILSFTGGGVVSKEVMDMLSVYGLLGLCYSKVDAGDDKNETDLAIGGGGMLTLTEQLSLYVEVAYIDDMIFGGGGTWKF